LSAKLSTNMFNHHHETRRRVPGPRGRPCSKEAP
jgi:hypothetical protein